MLFSSICVSTFNLNKNIYNDKKKEDFSLPYFSEIIKYK